MRSAHLTIAVTTVRLNAPSLLILSQSWLDKIRKTFSSQRDPSRCIVSPTTLPLCQVRMAPNDSEEEGIYISRFFIVGFLESLLDVSFTSRSLAQFNWHSFENLLIWWFFPWMYSAYHCWPELWHNIYYCVQLRDDPTVKENKHTHTHTHTHTHIHTHELSYYGSLA